MKSKILFSLTIIALLLTTQCKDSNRQDEAPPHEKQNYVPKDPADIEGDVKIAVASGKASSFQSGEEIDKSFDGDLNSYYHSAWNGAEFPITLEYTFAKEENIDYLVYHPRPNSTGDNGNLGELELWSSTDGNTFKKIGDYDFKFSESVSSITFSPTIEKVKTFKFVIKSGHNDFASCAEMAFYRYGNFEGLTDIFTNMLCTDLKSGVGQKEIDGMDNAFFKAIAQSILDETYPKEFRIQEYEPYPLRETTAKELKISGYNPFENPTGMYFSNGTNIIVLVDSEVGSENLSLCIHDFNSHIDTKYFLHPGINKIKVASSGLGYINYYTDNHKNLKPIKIHIPSAKVNGYFDKNKHKSQDWSRLIDAAISSYFDIKGNHINLVYTTDDLRAYTADGMALIDLYDEVVEIEHDIMGLKKFNKIPKNHMFARTVESGLFADGWGAGFAKDVMAELADPVKAKNTGIWAIAHELGHVNQIRPGLKWVGTTEVTNNVYSVVVRYHFTPNNLNLEQEKVNDGDNNHVLGGRFNSYLNYGIVKGEPWLCQRGQDKMENYENGGDHFVKLCPLWQLMLYYRIAEGTTWHKPDWYAEIAEIVRTTDEKNLSNGQLQLNFMRNVCDVVKEDLTDFFIKAGMLKPIDRNIDDYSRAQLTITQADCDALVKYASKYKKPQSPVIYYLTANSLNAYKKGLSVEGVFNKGVDMKSDEQYCTISGNVWKNVTVFETYVNETLVKVAMVGTDSQDKSSTLVRYPKNATRIEAVSWNGERTLVYGNR